MLAQEKVRRASPAYQKYQKDYQKKYEPGRDPEMRHRNTRDCQLKKYGLTQAGYEQMVLDREGKCDLCLEVPQPTKKRRYGLYVDHDHVTGRVRGLLCNRCNFALGHLRDRPDIAARVGPYLNHNLEG